MTPEDELTSSIPKKKKERERDIHGHYKFANMKGSKRKTNKNMVRKHLPPGRKGKRSPTLFGHKYIIENSKDKVSLAVPQRIMDNIGKADLVEALYHFGDPRYTLLATKILDSRFQDVTFWKLLQGCGMNTTDLISAFRKYKLDEALVSLLQGSPTVAEGTVEDASPQQVVCPRCDMKGWVADKNQTGEDIERKCPQCKGTGEIRQGGDIQNKKLVFEAAGLIKTGPQVAIQQNFHGFRPMDDIVKESTNLLEEGVKSSDS